MMMVLAVASLTGAPAAHADTLETPAPGARNLTAGGGWQAWAAPAGGGSWRLTLRAPDGTVSSPDIPAFGAAPDPGIGSDRFGFPRRLLVAYARCDGASATRGCDVYAFDLHAGTERRVDALASRTYSETAPSVGYGRWAFVRRGAGPRPGVYAWSGRGAPRRLSAVLGRETATNASRVAYTYNSARGGGVAVRRLSGRGSVWTPAAGLATVPRSVVLDRYHAGWLVPGGDGARAYVTTRFAGSDGPYAPRVVAGNRVLPAGTDAVAGSSAQLIGRYLDADGIKAITPKLWPTGTA
jgi:hypothetical protein